MSNYRQLDRGYQLNSPCLHRINLLHWTFGDHTLLENGRTREFTIGCWSIQPVRIDKIRHFQDRVAHCALGESFAGCGPAPRADAEFGVA